MMTSYKEIAIERPDLWSVIRSHIAIARPDHWIKNVFMLAGVAAVLVIEPGFRSWAILPSLLIAFMATCLIASSNYVINEILDAPYDRQHPLKKNRPIPNGTVRLPVAYAQWFVLGCSGLILAWAINLPFFLSALSLWIMGLIYNVPPIRSKEVPVIDVLSEAINNPIRLFLGWFATGYLIFPPSSFWIAYWMIGAFMMAAKRLAEFREIGDRNLAAAYRSSFLWYNEERLVVSMIGYGSGFMFFFAVLMTKYHPELILSAPFLMVFLSYFTKLAFEEHSIVQRPEQLLERPWFLAYSVFCFVLIVVLALTNIPSIHMLLGINGRPW